MPKITVVITTYNLEAMIGACLDELLAQTFQDFNILVVDDKSTDKTADIVSAYMARFPGRISTVLPEENLGSPSRTRNAALDSGCIDGDYVIFLDGDDSIEPDFLESLYTLVVEADADIAMCAYERVDVETGRVLCVEMQGFPAVVDLPPVDDTISFFNVSVWNKLIRTAIIGDVRFPDFCAGEDLCFFLRLYANCNRIALTERVLLHYRVRSASVTSNTPLEDIRAFAAELAKLYYELRDGACSGVVNGDTGGAICGDAVFTDAVELLVFIHIGVSMALRASDTPGINVRQQLSWTRLFFVEHFMLFKGSRFLRFGSLRRRGVRGLALWVCLLLYKLRSFGVFLFFYKLFRRVSRRDIKF